jgi:hypothetical protein
MARDKKTGLTDSQIDKIRTAFDLQLGALLAAKCAIIVFGDGKGLSNLNSDIRFAKKLRTEAYKARPNLSKIQELLKSKLAVMEGEQVINQNQINA